MLDELRAAALGDQDLALGERPPEERIVDGSQLRALCLELDAASARGLSLSGARVVGQLDLGATALKLPFLRELRVRRGDHAGVGACGAAGAAAVHGAGADCGAPDGRCRAGALAGDDSRELVAHPLPARRLTRRRGRARVGRGGHGATSRRRAGRGRRQPDRRRRHRAGVAPRSQVGGGVVAQRAHIDAGGGAACSSREPRSAATSRAGSVCGWRLRARRSHRRVSAPRRRDAREPLGRRLRPRFDRWRPHPAASRRPRPRQLRRRPRWSRRLLRRGRARVRRRLLALLPPGGDRRPDPPRGLPGRRPVSSAAPGSAATSTAATRRSRPTKAGRTHRGGNRDRRERHPDQRERGRPDLVHAQPDRWNLQHRRRAHREPPGTRRRSRVRPCGELDRARPAQSKGPVQIRGTRSAATSP